VKPDPFAAVAETHISTVFFAGDRAYKLLKPLRTGFLDHSTAERRAVACRREFDLNRRLAPDVYLGVSPIIEHDEVVDHLLVMKRLPSARRLTALLRSPERDDAVRLVARAVAAFHAAQPPDERAARVATRDAVAALWRHNFEEMRGWESSLLPKETFAEVMQLATQYLAGRTALFDSRISDGYARDGHGDLLAEDIFCLDDGPRILDCLAFDDDLRLGDTLLDVAFLAMDIERIAGNGVARHFLSWYQEFSAEHHPRSLVHHYIAYRALVRCKVGCLRADQGAAEAVAGARGYLELALSHLRAARPRMVLVGGAPGTGKTTTASALAARTGFALVSSDELRKDLAGVAHATHAFAPLDEGIYGEAMTERMYAELLDHARRLLELGESVVLDASWTTASRREAARAVARAAHADTIELRCTLDPVIAAERIEHRLASEASASDATPALAAQLALRADPWPEATELDTLAPPADVATIANAVVGTT
jgi:aminoglycoside phosphotransferase family enzyme/predicted kinase